MSAKKKLKDALEAIESASGALRRAQQSVPGDENIRRAIRELEEAEDLIQRAEREVRKTQVD